MDPSEVAAAGVLTPTPAEVWPWMTVGKVCTLDTAVTGCN